MLDLGLQIDAIDFKPDGTFTVKPKPTTARPDAGKQPDRKQSEWDDEL